MLHADASPYSLYGIIVPLWNGELHAAHAAQKANPTFIQGKFYFSSGEINPAGLSTLLIALFRKINR